MRARAPGPERFFPWLLAAAACFHAALLPRRFVGYFVDDAEFILRALSLLHGRYDTAWLPGRPADNLFLPGFPLLLAPFAWLAAPHWAWLKLVPFGLTLLSGWLFWRLLEGRLKPAPRLALAAALLFNPALAGLSGAVMADVFLLAAVLTVFLLMEREDVPDWALGLALGWTSVIRPVAALILPASALALGPSRGWRKTARILGWASAAWLLVMLRNRLAAHGATGYAELWGAVRPFSAAACLDGLHRSLFVLFGPTATGLRPPAPGWASAAVAGSGLALVLAGLPALLSGRRPWLVAAAAFSGGCFLVQCLWPYAETRYFVPLLPFILVALWEGGRRLGRGLPRPRFWLAAALIVWGGAYAWRGGRLLSVVWLRPAPLVERFPGRTLAWIARQTPRDAVILGRAPVICLYTGRQGYLEIPAEDAEQFRYRCLLAGVTHVAHTPASILSVPGGGALDQVRGWNRNMGWAASWPEAFERIFSDADEQASVYRVVRDDRYVEAYEAFLAGRLDEALRLRPNLAAALCDKAFILSSSGRLRESRRLLEKALAVRPDHAWALALLSELEARQGRLREARILCGRAEEARRRTGEFPSLGPVACGPF